MTTPLATFLDEQARRLCDGTPAPTVLATLATRYTTLSSIATAVSHVRSRILERGARSSSYDDAPLRAVAGDASDVHAFLEAPLRTQVAVQRSHRAHRTWTAAQEAALAALELLPANAAALALTREQTSTLKRKRADALVKKSQRLLVIDADAVLTNARALLESAKPTASFASLILPLLVCCGRRLTELCGRGTFEPVPGRTHAARFTGQLKTKRTAHRTYDIPLLIPYHAFRAGLDALRAKQGDGVAALTNAQIKSRYQPNTQRDLEIGKAMPSLPSVMHVHETRSIYVAMVYHLYEPSVTFAACAMKCLGHASLEESLHYQSVRLANADHLRHSLGPLEPGPPLSHRSTSGAGEMPRTTNLSSSR